MHFLTSRQAGIYSGTNVRFNRLRVYINELSQIVKAGKLLKE